MLCRLAKPARPRLTPPVALPPQTWEDPSVEHAETKAKGDNDPLDVCEIGEAVGYVGQIKQVKVLGIMALLDEGETDWKVLVVDVNDPLAPRLNDVEDVERHLPGLIRVGWGGMGMGGWGWPADVGGGTSLTGHE